VTAELGTTGRVGRYFEEFSSGQRFVGPSRTLTEADLVAFCGLTGDYNALHTDEVAARSGRFGARVFHGLFGMAVTTGLLERLAVFEGTAIASLGVRDWTFEQPIYIGDTVYPVMDIGVTRLSSSGAHGVVERFLQLRRADDVVLQRGAMDILVATRQAGRHETGDDASR
jgi:acyl dehydratase